MKKGVKICIIITIPLIIIISAVTIFENITFEEDFTLIEKFFIPADDILYNSNPSHRGISEADIEMGLIFTDNEEFNNYTKEFDYTDYYLAFSSKLPIKK